MIKNLLLILTVLSLSAVASAKTYHVKLFQASMVGATQLPAGEYKLDLDGTKVKLSDGKKIAEAEVKVEQVEQKYNSTTVRYQNGDGNYHIQEIRLGGAAIKLVFNN